MGRRSGANIFLAIARDLARQQRQAEAARNRAMREMERQTRAAQRDAIRLERTNARTLKEFEREEKARYLSYREQEAADLNADIRAKLALLEGILPHASHDPISFDSLRVHETPPCFVPPPHLHAQGEMPREAAYLRLSPPTGIRAFFPGAKRRYERQLISARGAYEAALTQWRDSEARRVAQLTLLEQEHANAVAAVVTKKAQRNAEVDTFEAQYRARDRDSVIAYCTMVLERSSYPEDFPQNISITYTVSSELLVVEYELPAASIVPNIVEYRYVRSTDTISGKPRKESEVKDLYQDVIASVALRTIDEIFKADRGNHVAALCFNGYINTIDPATGHDIQPHLISVRTTKQRFSEIDLARVDKRVCLKNLGAQVSRRPDEAQPVKPIVEFRMVDARFVDQTDLVSGLSPATNLMDLNPYEFENLVANLFGQMGLESKLTRSSRDGGVDCVAYDPRPVLGGKVVIQAKRYRHTVGVSAVRDLFGTMMNEGANKGILVTTSGYGPDAFDFAKEKPIELIDGGGLLFLLQEIGVQARIVFPEGA
jgi:restriction system protein